MQPTEIRTSADDIADANGKRLVRLTQHYLTPTTDRVFVTMRASLRSIGRYANGKPLDEVLGENDVLAVDQVWSKRRQTKKATGLTGRQWVKKRKSVQRAVRALARLQAAAVAIEAQRQEAANV